MGTSLTESTVKRYGCSSCGKTWSSKKRAQRHVDEECIRDPDKRACATCEHDGWREGGAWCEKGIRPDDVMCVRNCPEWKLYVSPFTRRVVDNAEDRLARAYGGNL